ncbi:hypothetical protein ACO2Q3_02655 [Caulobacter sp. KR2-114]|uniref:hypothetical protein n=1 Tax=Caulobacter sp. KR2-114 TaxID=3400912 RepID=UPI003C0D9B67
MRRLLAPPAALIPALIAALAVPVLALADPPPPGQLQTPDQAGQSSVGMAAAAPMHDMNLMRQKIPPVLLAAMADPYARPNPATCRNLSALVNELTVALGDDLDVVADEDDSTRAKRDRLAREGLHAGSEALLPFAGFVRKLSGAEQHDKLVLDAITSGDVRRAYLKGLGEARGCPPPATPRHLTHPISLPVDDGGHRKPQYPIH